MERFTISVERVAVLAIRQIDALVPVVNALTTLAARIGRLALAAIAVASVAGHSDFIEIAAEVLGR